MGRGGVVVNLSQLIACNLNKLVMAQLFNNVNIDAIMYDMTNIMAGCVSEKWFETFVNNLTQEVIFYAYRIDTEEFNRKKS